MPTPADRSDRRALLLEVAESGRELEVDPVYRSGPTTEDGVPEGPAVDGAPRRRRHQLRAVSHRPVLLAGGVLMVLGLAATATAAASDDEGDSERRGPAASEVRNADQAAASPTIPVPASTAAPTVSEAPPPDAEAPPPDAEAPPPEPEPAPEPAPEPTAPKPPPVPPTLNGWMPKTIRIPALEVDAPVDSMGVDAENALEVPEDPTRAGWWSGGAQPGQADPAVIVGHLDSSTGPAVFFGLDKLKAGDVIEVDRADDSTARFMVYGLESHPKTEFPTLSVYGGTEDATLRLITCFGEFDPVARSYKNNLVVYANLLP